MIRKLLFKSALALFSIFFCVELVNAQCSEAHSGSGTPLSGNVTGQSFTLGGSCSGFLQNISFDILGIDDVMNDVILTVYSGNGVGGANLGSLTGVTLVANQTNVIDVSSLNIAVSASAQYTFILDKNGAAGFINFDGNTTYSDGGMYLDGTYFEGFDIKFTIGIVPSLSVNSREKLNLKIYPNPTTNYLKVSTIASGVTYDIVHLSGKRIIENQTLNVNKEIDVRDLSNGMYFLRFENGGVAKFIKQ